MDCQLTGYCTHAGKPAYMYMMDRSNVDWAPCLNLCHDEISMSALQAASGRATRAALRTR